MRPLDRRLLVALVAVAAVMVVGVTILGGYPADVGTDGPRAATPTPGPPPFTVSVTRVVPCGELCRDVTIQLRNDQAVPAREVGVTVELYAGRGVDGPSVWTGYEYVGRVEPGATATVTRRVGLNFRQALALDRANYWLTIETTIEYNDRVVTFTDERRIR